MLASKKSKKKDASSSSSESSSESGSESSSDDSDDDAPRNCITGKKIKMHREMTAQVKKSSEVFYTKSDL